MKDIDKIISRTSEQTASAVVYELKRQGLMRDNRHTPFQKTEQLLYNYNNFKDAIENKNEQIKGIQEEGIPKKSKSITSWSGNHSIDTTSDDERAEDKIQAIESSIVVTRKFIAIIDAALEKVSTDAYFDIIKLKYFQGQTGEQIAEHFDVDVSTISRNKNRLINMLKITLFSDEVIYELFS